MDEAFQRAVDVSDAVSEELASQYPEEETTYAHILASLAETMSAGKVICAEFTPQEGEANAFGVTNVSTGKIFVNVNYWEDHYEHFQRSKDYGQLDDPDIVALLAEADPVDYSELLDEAMGYLYGPAVAAQVLVHEAAHLVTAPDYKHTLDSSESLPDEADFVTAAGQLTLSTFYQEIWLREYAWLDNTWQEFQDDP